MFSSVYLQRVSMHALMLLLLMEDWYENNYDYLLPLHCLGGAGVVPQNCHGTAMGRCHGTTAAVQWQLLGSSMALP